MKIDLSQFRCKMCGACCRLPGEVRLTPGDIAPLANALGVDEQTFIDEHTRLSCDRRALVLLDGDDGACAMLRKDNTCAVQEAKPAQCRGFPHHWHNPNSFRDCPALATLVSAQKH